MRNSLLCILCVFALLGCHEKESFQRVQLSPTILTDSIYTVMPGDLMFTGQYLVWSDPFTDSHFLHVHDLKGKELGAMGKSGQGPREFVSPMTNRFCVDNSFFVVDANGNTRGYLSIDSLLSGKEPLVLQSEEERQLKMAKIAKDVYYERTTDGTEHYFTSCIHGKTTTWGVYPVRQIRQHLGGYSVYDASRGLLAYTSFTLPYLALYKQGNDSFRLLWDLEPPVSSYDIIEGKLIADRNKMGGGDITICKDYIVVLQRDYETDPTNESTVGRDISKCPHTIFLYDFDSRLKKVVDLGMPVMRIAASPTTNKLYVIGAFPDYVLAEYDL